MPLLRRSLDLIWGATPEPTTQRFGEFPRDSIKTGDRRSRFAPTLVPLPEQLGFVLGADPSAFELRRPEVQAPGKLSASGLCCLAAQPGQRVPRRLRDVAGTQAGGQGGGDVPAGEPGV